MRISDWSSDGCSSDLGVVANVADEVVVMYHGEIVESGAAEDIFQTPQHPYLRALLRAVPRFYMRPGERLVPIREIRQQGDSSFFGKATVHDTSGGGPLLKVEHVSKSFSIRKAGLLGGDTSGTVLAVDDVSRSEEHTSELQSLMRNSYAVV